MIRRFHSGKLAIAECIILIAHQMSMHAGDPIPDRANLVGQPDEATCNFSGWRGFVSSERPGLCQHDLRINPRGSFPELKERLSDLMDFYVHQSTSERSAVGISAWQYEELRTRSSTPKPPILITGPAWERYLAQNVRSSSTLLFRSNLKRRVALRV